MAAIENLKASVQRLNVSADKVIERLKSAPAESEVQAASDAVTAVADKLDASVV